MSSGNFKMAVSSLRRSRGRSFLTMLGIVIGVVAVILTISIGAGVKKQMTDQVNQISRAVITVRPGSADRSTNYIAAGGVFAGLGASPLTADDVKAVQQSNGVGMVVPLGVGPGFATVEEKKLDGGSVIATSENMAKVIRQKVEFGVFFDEKELDSNVVVIGNRVAEDLFDENAPIGRTLSIRGQDFIVRGVFEQFTGNPVSLGTDLNKSVFIPFPMADKLTNGNVPVAQIYAQADDAAQVEQVQQAITRNLTVAHAGQQDFVVLTRTQSLESSATSVNLITQLISGIAALSLLVGGIGIINIMLVSVTERTREIGIRKAIGATNRQILNQFLVEAATLSGLGGLIGVLLALLGIFIVTITTNLQPVINLPIMIGVPVAAWCLGIIFGVAPAVQAARKDPIDALRYE